VAAPAASSVGETPAGTTAGTVTVAAAVAMAAAAGAEVALGVPTRVLAALVPVAVVPEVLLVPAVLTEAAMSPPPTFCAGPVESGALTVLFAPPCRPLDYQTMTAAAESPPSLSSLVAAAAAPPRPLRFWWRQGRIRPKCCAVLPAL